MPGTRKQPSKAEPRLAQYQRKRDFGQTPEPEGAPPAPSETGARRFVPILKVIAFESFDLSDS